MQFPKFNQRRCSRCIQLICCGISCLLLFFFAWRAVFAIAGLWLIVAGCGSLRRH